VDEVIREWLSDADNSVNPFFNSDRAPLTGREIADALLLLDWNRADLLASIEGLSPSDLAREVENSWDISRILLHTGVSEWWYMDRLDLAFPKADGPKEPMACLETVRSYFKTIVPTLLNDDWVVETDFEIGSPRKILRRALWHEGDQMLHIERFRGRFRERLK
jgi:hypothetical protein